MIGIPTCVEYLYRGAEAAAAFESIILSSLKPLPAKQRLVFSLEGESKQPQESSIRSSRKETYSVFCLVKVYKDERVLITNSHYISLAHSLSVALFLGFPSSKKLLLIRLTGAAAKRSSGHYIYIYICKRTLKRILRRSADETYIEKRRGERGRNRAKQEKSTRTIFRINRICKRFVFVTPTR